jgi:hypothetical protein
MAKDPGLSFKTEQDFEKNMGTTMNPKAFQQVVQQLRTNNLSAKSISADNISAKTLAEPVIKDSKEIKSKQEELKSNEKLLDSHKKLTTNIEKLTKTISDSVLGKNKAKADRAEDIAGKQKLDYRGIGQQFKEKIMGRGGDKFDTNSLRYKLGSLRGLARTTGLVSEGGFIDNKLAVREERLRTATRMTEANAGMENLKQFGSKAAVEQYYQRRGQDTIKARAGLQSEEYNREKYREAGISDEEYERTTGGKQQVKKLAEAGQAVINVDPRLQGEKKGDIRFAGPDDDKLNVSEEEDSQLRAIESASQPMEELISITKVEIERKTKADMDLLEAIKGIESKGGVLGGIASALGGGAALKGVALKGAASGGGLLAGAAGGLLGGGLAAGAGMAVQYGGDKLKEAGYEQTGKAVGVGGTALKYAGIGGMIGSVVPGVGTAIGAGVGGLIGAGKGAYDQYFSDDAKVTESSSSISGKVVQGKADGPITLNGQTLNPGDPGYDKAAKELANLEDDEEGAITDTQAMKSKDKAKMQLRAERQNANQVASQSSDNAMAKTPSNAASSNTIVNAPTNISKQTQNTAVNVPIRDQDHSIRKYYNSRFAT